MDELPGEVLLLVMSFCEAAELAALAATSHGLASFALDDPQWRRLFAAHFFEPPQPPPLAPQYLPPSALSTSAAVCSANSNNDDKEQGPRVQDWPVINPRLAGASQTVTSGLRVLCVQD
jgi:hypothetical protein